MLSLSCSSNFISISFNCSNDLFNAQATTPYNKNPNQNKIITQPANVILNPRNSSWISSFQLDLQHRPYHLCWCALNNQYPYITRVMVFYSMSIWIGFVGSLLLLSLIFLS